MSLFSLFVGFVTLVGVFNELLSSRFTRMLASSGVKAMVSQLGLWVLHHPRLRV